MDTVFQIVLAIVATIAVPIMIWGVGKLTKYLDEKIAEIKDQTLQDLVRRAVDTVQQIVLYIMQTYVDSLKQKGQFDKEAQKEALEKAREQAEHMIDEKTKAAIATQYGSFSGWLDTKIEQTVRETKISTQ